MNKIKLIEGQATVTKKMEVGRVSKLTVLSLGMIYVVVVVLLLFVCFIHNCSRFLYI